MNRLKHEFKLLNLSATVKAAGVALLAVIALLTLFLLFLGLVDSRPTLALYVDNLLSVLFLVLFVFLFWLSNDRKEFVKKNWWLLLAAIPLGWIDNGGGTALQAANIIAIGRFMVRIALLVRISRRLIPRTYALIVATSLASTVLISSALFYSAEHDLNPDVNTYFDSFWWAMVTGTTIGYGDIVPVTTTGRWVGIVLMVFGLGIFGFVTGSVASLLSNRAKKLASNSKRD